MKLIEIHCISRVTKQNPPISYGLVEYLQTITGTKYCFFKNIKEYWTQFLVNVVLKLSLLRGDRCCRFTLDYVLWRSTCRSAVDFTTTVSSEWRRLRSGGSRLVRSSSCILNVAESFFFKNNHFIITVQREFRLWLEIPRNDLVPDLPPNKLFLWTLP